MFLAINEKYIGVSSLSTTDQREAYFNGSVYIRLAQPMTLWRHSALSFRTCRGKSMFLLLHTIYFICCGLVNNTYKALTPRLSGGQKMQIYLESFKNICISYLEW